MFERAILNPAPARRWVFSAGMAGEAVLVAAALLVPLVTPQILPRAEIITAILSPPSPVAAFKPAPPAQPRRVRAWSAASLFYPPAAAPRIAITEELPAPDVPAGASGGSDGPQSLLAGLLGPELRPAPPPKPPAAPRPGAVTANAPPALIRVSGSVQAARLVRRVEPEYPFAARQLRVSGTVELSGIIGTDGRIRELHVTGGNPWLVRAALDAVRQWIYQPTLLGGKPVEVLTTIQVNFRLR